MSKINATINNKKITVEDNVTVLQAARENSINIPTLCQHPDLPPRSSCRLCLVEIEGMKGPVTSCNTIIKDKMKIKTDTDEIKSLRKTNLELIFGEHHLKCAKCVRSNHCLIKPLAQEFDANISAYPLRKKDNKLCYGNIMILEQDKCMECGNCVTACENLSVGYLKLENNGSQTFVNGKAESACIACGQCAIHCPLGAIHARGAINAVKDALSRRDKKIVIQFAPSIRVSIGEEFGLPSGSIVTGQLIAALKKLNPDWVVDTSLGADFTTYAEAAELKERLEKNEKLPMMTACCPAWVNYVETYHPDLIPNLTTIRSPHINIGGLIKHVFSKRTSLKPKDLFVISIMPCTAKKVEIERQELSQDGIKAVDAVLSTRELAFLLKEKSIDLSKLPEEKSDSPLGVESGSGTIYGASGGVMEAALRTANYFITGSELTHIGLKEVRGMKHLKTAEVKIGAKNLKVAVVNGLECISTILDELKQNPNAYDYIEVMACRGGCIGGGGQPIPINDTIRENRQKALYNIDQKNKIRFAHENAIVKDVMAKELKNPVLYHSILETTYKKRGPTPLKIIMPNK